MGEFRDDVTPQIARDRHHRRTRTYLVREVPVGWLGVLRVTVEASGSVSGGTREWDEDAGLCDVVLRYGPVKGNWRGDVERFLEGIPHGEIAVEPGYECVPDCPHASHARKRALEAATRPRSRAAR